MSYTSLDFVGDSTSYLSVPSTNLSFGTGDFTIEWWQYQTDSNDYPRIFQIGDYPSNQIGVSIETGTFYYWSDSSYIFAYTLPAYKNRWVHFAIVRSSGLNTIYLNGTRIGSSFSDAYEYSFSVDLVIANETTPSNGAAFGGQLYNFEWLIGTAKYTSSFTPSVNIPSDPGSYALVLNGSYSGGSESGSVTNSNVGTSANVPTPPVPPSPSVSTDIYRHRISSTSFGSFWYGKGTNFPGFLFKKNTGVGGRRSTKFAAGGNSTCNTYQNVNNKYVSGSGVNGSVSSTNYAIRRKMIRNASNCLNNNCSINYFYMGVPLTFVTKPPSPPVVLICSNNYTTSGDLPVGEPVLKDMSNENYTYQLDPAEYPEFFPGMAPFTDGNIVAGDKDSGDRLIGSYWNDWGDDIFDEWGWFYLYDVNSGKYYFPLINPQNQSDGVITTQIFNVFGRTFTIKQGYPVQGIFKFDITVNDDLPFRFGAYGNMGSDFYTQARDLTYSYSLNNTDLTLYYEENIDTRHQLEKFYSYWIPKRTSQNNLKTYTITYSYSDDMGAVSNSVTNGLIVYLSKSNDVKLWVVNDLKICGDPSPTVPTAPTITRVVAGYEDATIYFNPPSSNGGSAITSYTVTSDPDGIFDTGTSSPITLSRLTGGTTYTFTVYATNFVGDSPPSSASNPVTPLSPTVPSAPTIRNAVAGYENATIYFNPPSNNGGSTITGYTVTSSPGGITQTGTSSPITISSLTGGTTYTFTVYATNSVGDSPASSASNPVTPPTVPTAPTITNAVAGDGNATITFTAPTSNGGSTILTYTVTSSPDGLTSSVSYPATSITISGLVNHTAYTFTLVATNAIGDSPSSNTSSSVTPLPIGTLTQTFTTVGTSTWTAPSTTRSVTYLVVGGGGGGGAAYDNGGAGGGGGGMVLSGSMSVTPGTTYTIVVGNGGAGGIGTGVAPVSRTETNGSNGGYSSFDTIVALGGGYGYKSRGYYNNTSSNAANGGTQVSGSSTASTGGSGGGGGRGGGGGGGESSNGTNGAAYNGTGSAGGSGGSGVSNSITGTSLTYGAGGDGGSSNSGSNGPTPTVFNRGNGGHGGGSYSGNSKSGRDGDAGVVIITYEY
jgi:Fibronectin type III domain